MEGMIRERRIVWMLLIEPLIPWCELRASGFFEGPSLLK
jgi:hypothetical protein